MTCPNCRGETHRYDRHLVCSAGCGWLQDAPRVEPRRPQVGDDVVLLFDEANGGPPPIPDVIDRVWAPPTAVPFFTTAKGYQRPYYDNPGSWRWPATQGAPKDPDAGVPYVCLGCRRRYETCPDFDAYNCPACGEKVCPVNRPAAKAMLAASQGAAVAGPACSCPPHAEGRRCSWTNWIEGDCSCVACHGAKHPKSSALSEGPNSEDVVEILTGGAWIVSGVNWRRDRQFTSGRGGEFVISGMAYADADEGKTWRRRSPRATPSVGDAIECAPFGVGQADVVIDADASGYSNGKPTPAFMTVRRYIFRACDEGITWRRPPAPPTSEPPGDVSVRPHGAATAEQELEAYRRIAYDERQRHIARERELIAAKPTSEPPRSYSPTCTGTCWPPCAHHGTEVALFMREDRNRLLVQNADLTAAKAALEVQLRDEASAAMDMIQDWSGKWCDMRDERDALAAQLKAMREALTEAADRLSAAADVFDCRDLPLQRDALEEAAQAARAALAASGPVKEGE